MKDIKKIVGEKVQEIREQKRLTVDDLAARSGVNRANLYKLEKGELNITIENLNKIAQALFVSVGELVG